MAGVKTGAGPLAVPGPGKVSGADLEGQGRQGELRALSAWLAFELEYLPTCCPCSASPNPSSTTQTPCLRAFRSSGSGARRGQAIPESRILHPSVPVFLPFILYQIQLIFPERLLSVKNRREVSPQINPAKTQKWNRWAGTMVGAVEGYHVGRGADTGSGWTLK